jgi:hypothetical protein
MCITHWGFEQWQHEDSPMRCHRKQAEDMCLSQSNFGREWPSHILERKWRQDMLLETLILEKLFSSHMIIISYRLSVRNLFYIMRRKDRKHRIILVHLWKFCLLRTWEVRGRFWSFSILSMRDEKGYMSSPGKVFGRIPVPHMDRFFFDFESRKERRARKEHMKTSSVWFGQIRKVSVGGSKKEVREQVKFIPSKQKPTSKRSLGFRESPSAIKCCNPVFGRRWTCGFPFAIRCLSRMEFI